MIDCDIDIVALDQEVSENGPEVIVDDSDKENYLDNSDNCELSLRWKSGHQWERIAINQECFNCWPWGQSSLF